jgi:hypothetical protein
MANASRRDSVQSALDWPRAFGESLMQTQRAQLEALLSWQQSLAAIHKEWWDEWVCRWAGGAPIDA